MGRYLPTIERTPAPPRQPTAPEKKAILSAAAAGLPVRLAANLAKVPEDYVWCWLANGKILSDDDAKPKGAVDKACLDLWKGWLEKRATLVLKQATKIAKSKGWGGAAWLLERVEPGTFRPTATAAPVKRDVHIGEDIVEAEAVKDDAAYTVSFVVPDNGRGPT